MVTATEFRDLQVLEEQLRPVAGVQPGDYDTRVQYLRLVRKLQLRRSALVAQHGLLLLNDKATRRKLGDEAWDVLEQVALACMDTNALSASKECIGALMVKFPKSARVGRLEGMWLEAQGWWDQAERIYTTLLQDHPQDQKVMKRQVAMLRAQGRLQEAAQQLKTYLETYQADMDAWRELADMYLSLSMLRHAAFCQEELLLSAPANPLYNLHYAETLYSIGGLDSLKAARSYYAAAIEHSQGESVRALWGVCMADAAVRLSFKGPKSREDASPSEVARLAAQALQQMYDIKCPPNKPLVDATLEHLALFS